MAGSVVKTFRYRHTYRAINAVQNAKHKFICTQNYEDVCTHVWTTVTTGALATIFIIMCNIELVQYAHCETPGHATHIYMYVIMNLFCILYSLKIFMMLAFCWQMQAYMNLKKSIKHASLACLPRAWNIVGQLAFLYNYKYKCRYINFIQ